MIRQLARACYRTISPAGKRARLSIFIFHRVLPTPDPLLPWEPDAIRFDKIVSFIANSFHVMPLTDAVRRLGNGTLPAAAASITFDDGYADNYTVAAPILKRQGVNATFFIATGYINGGRMWNDSIIEAVRSAPPGEFDGNDFGLGCYQLDEVASRVHAYEQMIGKLKYHEARERELIADEVAKRANLGERSELMMTKDQLVALHAMGMEIGGHTVTHPILAGLGEAEAMAEIAEGRSKLASWLGRAPDVFAYPNGLPGKDYTLRDVDCVRRAGYEAAVSTERGVAGRPSDRFQLPRFTPWDKSMWRFGIRCAFALSQGPLSPPLIAPELSTSGQPN